MGNFLSGLLYPSKNGLSAFVLSSGYFLQLATMDFRPRETLFFGDNFFGFDPIGSKFSHHTFQPKRRFLSIWSVNKKSKIRVLVIAS